MAAHDMIFLKKGTSPNLRFFGVLAMENVTLHIGKENLYE